MISFRVFGDPAPQGSKTIMRGRLVESSKKLPAWRKAVTEAAEQVDFYTEDAVDVLIIFYMPKPKSLKRKRPSVKPDIDKLIRSVSDCLSGTVIKDDAQIVTISARKEYSDEPGAEIQVVETL